MSVQLELFPQLLEEAVSKSDIERIGVKYFPSDSIYATEYKGENYLAVNFTDPEDMEKYFPKTWDLINEMIEDLDPEAFTFVAFIGVNNIGVSFYTTDKMHVSAKAETKPDGTGGNSAAVKMIARLKIEERVKKLQKELEDSDVEVAEEAIRFEDMTNVVSASVPLEDVDVTDTDNLSRKLAGMLEVPFENVEVFVNGDSKRLVANVDVPMTSDLSGDDVEDALRKLVGM